MKKLLTASLTLLLAGCASVPPADNVSYPVQTDENVQNTQQTADPGQNSTESGTDLPDTQDSAENDDLGEPNQVEEDSRERAETDEPEVVDAPNVAEYALSHEIVDDEICKLREDSYPRNNWPDSALAASFPAISNLSMPLTGTINVKVVYVEWDDLKGTQDDYDYNLWSTKMFSDFYRVMSEGKLNLKVTAEPEWLNVGASWERDVVPAGMEGGDHRSVEYLQPVIDRWVAAVDADVDFTGVDVIIFGLPSKEIVIDALHTFGRTGVFARTDEGTITDMYSLGQRIYDHKDSQPGWAQFSHEFGHALGMPDLRDWTQGQRDVPMYVISPMYGHEIMDNQNSGSRSISGWIKWVQGWLNDSQVECVEANSIDYNLYQLDSANIVGGKTELVTVKVSNTKLIAIESTRWDSRFDLRTTNPADGVIVYTVDSTLGHQEGPLRLVSPRDIGEYLSDNHIWPDWRVLDVVMAKGDSVTVDGITIRVEESSGSKDIISISR